MAIWSRQIFYIRKFFIWFCFNLTRNTDPDKYFYSGYGIEFDAHSDFLLSCGDEFGKNVIIFQVDNSSYLQAADRKRIS